jgi:hypothetical protein
MGSMGFSYSVHEGVVMDEPDAQDRWLDQYGFIPDRFVPVLGQYQAIRDPDYRQIVGTTAWARTGIAGLNWMVSWATLGNSSLITAAQRRAMVMAGAAFPKSPYGILIRGATWLSAGILLYDFYTPKLKQHFKMFLSSLNPMNYSPFMV